MAVVNRTRSNEFNTSAQEVYTKHLVKLIKSVRIIKLGRLWKPSLKTSENTLDVPSKTSIGLVEIVTPRKFSVTIYREQYLLFDTLNREENQTTHTDLKKEPDLLRAATASMSVSR